MPMFNEIVAWSLPFVPKAIVRIVAQRYIAGETLQDAIATVGNLNRNRASATVDVLGEFVESRQQAEHETRSGLAVLDAIAHNNLHAGLSVKLTSLGLGIDEDFCYRNLRSLTERARDHKRFIRIDMENSPYTTATLQQYRRLRDDGFDNVGVVIQAYMRRSEDDIRALAELGASVRLCKGIYDESPEIAFKERDEIRDNFMRLLRLLFELDMFAGIATHDKVLLDGARQLIEETKRPADRYEFQMLLGVCENLRSEIIAQGFKMRVYVPFGSDWYGYSLRRLRENPQMAGHVLRAFFTGK